MNQAHSSANGTVVRRAGQADVSRILDLLTEYELPRSFFEPFYLDDPTYRPEHSWVVEQNGVLAAHLRLFDRWIRLHGTRLHVAGVGNVITSRSCRGQGHAGRLLDAMTAAAIDEDFPYSLLWTHLPTLYQRYGWAQIEQQTLRALISELPSQPRRIRAFRAEDLPSVKRVYDTTNELRTGPTLRSAEYWRAQLAWLANEPGEFLVSEGEDGSLAGYIRSRITRSEVRILELGVPAEDLGLGRALMARAAQPRGQHVQMRLPNSLLEVIPQSERDTEDDSRFMGRVLSLNALVRTLEPVLVQRLQAAGVGEAVISLNTSAGSADLRVSGGRATLSRPTSMEARACVNEAELAHLVLRGFDAMAAELMDGRRDTALLRTLFPAQDFVVWPADAF